VRENEHKTMERLRKVHIESLFPVKFKPLVVLHNMLLYSLNIALTLIHTRKELLGQKEITPYAGHQWWALKRDTVHYIFSFLAENMYFVKFFKFCKHSDEMFFHTIVGNSHFKENTEPCLTYTDWREQDHHPATITSDHINTICLQGNFHRDEVYGDGQFLFLRKLTEEDDPLMDRIDNELR